VIVHTSWIARYELAEVNRFIRFPDLCIVVLRRRRDPAGPQATLSPRFLLRLSLRATRACRVADACEHSEHTAQQEIGAAIPPRLFHPCVLEAAKQRRYFEPAAHVVAR